MQRRAFCNVVIWFALLVPCLVARAASEAGAAATGEIEGHAELHGTSAGLASVLRAWLSEVEDNGRDPLAIVADVGAEPESLRAWVRKTVQYVPYRGSLRGGTGVLVDRFANSLDSALLLADLLRSAGHDVRLARGELSSAQVATIISHRVPRSPASSQELSDAQLIKLFAADSRLDRKQVDEAVQQAAENRAALRQRVEKRFALSHEAVRAAFGNQFSKVLPALEAQKRSRAVDHWWAQVRLADRYHDVDPLREELGAVAVRETITVDALPASLHHTVIVRVVLEVSRPEGREEVVLLEREVRPTVLFDTPVVLRHLFLTQGSAAARESGASDPNIVARRMLQETRWAPVLSVGEDTVYQQVFSADGSIAKADAAGLLGTTQGFQALNESLSAAMTGTRSAGGARGEPTAEWLEFEFRVPGETTRQVRRVIFDLVGPAARERGQPVTIDAPGRERRALALVGVHEILAFGVTPDAQMLSVQSARDLVTVLEQISSATDPRGATGTVQARRLALPLRSYAILRAQFPTLVPVQSLDRPNVVVLHDEIHLGTDGQYKSLVGIDIVENAVAASSSSLSQGVLDTVIEGALLEVDEPHVNAAALMEQDMRSGRTWRLIQPGTGPTSTITDVPDDPRALWSQQMAAGASLLIGPPRASTLPGGDAAAWRFDPQTAAVLGLDSRGRGLTQAEKSAVFWLEFSEGLYCAFKSLADVALHKQIDAMADALCIAGAIVGGYGGVHFAAALGGVVEVASVLFLDTLPEVYRKYGK